MLLLIPGIISLMLPGGFKPGIEFSSGTTFAARFDQPVDERELRAALAELGHPDARIQKTTDGRFLIRTDLIEGAAQPPPIGPAPPSEREELEDALQERFGPLVDSDGKPIDRFLEFSSVSPSVSSDIGRNAALAVLAAPRWRSWSTSPSRSGRWPKPLRYGVCAIVALLHDVLLVLGAASILGRFVRLRDRHVVHHGRC